MPARHRGVHPSFGSASTAAGLLGVSLDFLVPSLARSVTSRRCYARAAVKVVEEDAEYPEEVRGRGGAVGESARLQSRTGEAVGEGSSTGGVRRTREWGLKSTSRRKTEVRLSRPSWKDVDRSASTGPMTTESSPAADARYNALQPLVNRMLARRKSSDPGKETPVSKPIDTPLPPAPLFDPASALQPEYRSIIHKHLSRMPPPKPPPLFDHISHNPSRSTSPALTTLTEYARRTGHYRIQKATGNARARSDISYRLSNDLGSYGYDLKPGSYLHGQTLAALPWAAKAFSPKSFDHPLDVHQALRDLHYRLITSGRRPAPGVRDIIADMRYVCAMEGRGESGVLEAMSGVLNLLMIYAERVYGHNSTERILQDILRLCPELKPTKQSLHLIVLGLLWPRQLDYHATTHDWDDGPPGRSQKIPSDDPDIRQRLLELFTRFGREHKVIPGTETFREIVLFASMKDDPVLCQVGFDGWWHAYSASAASSSSGSSSSSPESEPKPMSKSRARSGLTPGEGDTPRFQHLGQRWQLFRTLLRTLVRRGWVRQSNARTGISAGAVEGVEGPAPYIWCGPSEVGMDDIAQEGSMTVEEVAGVRAKRARWASRAQGGFGVGSVVEGDEGEEGDGEGEGGEGVGVGHGRYEGDHEARSVIVERAGAGPQERIRGKRQENGVDMRLRGDDWAWDDGDGDGIGDGQVGEGARAESMQRAKGYADGRDWRGD